jgi:methionine sulfoxide reductase catalytic subunit
MLIKRHKGWEMPESQATPEALFLARRHVLAGAGAIAATVMGGGAFSGQALAEAADPTLDLYPARRNPGFTLDRAVTDEKLSSSYNNFYEFGTSKRIASEARALKTRPWTVKIDGLVEKPLELGIDDIIRAMPIEERLYRHRCVEAWSMAVPWTGFPLSALLARAKPLSGAKYVRMETFLDARVAPGQKQGWYPWPYVEGLTMAEAANDLAFMVTGVYGKPLPNQFGAPLRLAVPWKYGFKSVKSITRISFVAERPKTFWEGLQSSEYGFWANVNPAVSHPRWSQATEEVLGERDRRPTQIFNGYGELVADLYKGLEKERLFV